MYIYPVRIICAKFIENVADYKEKRYENGENYSRSKLQDKV